MKTITAALFCVLAAFSAAHANPLATINAWQVRAQVAGITYQPDGRGGFKSTAVTVTDGLTFIYIPCDAAPATYNYSTTTGSKSFGYGCLEVQGGDCVAASGKNNGAASPPALTFSILEPEKCGL